MTYLVCSLLGLLLLGTVYLFYLNKKLSVLNSSPIVLGSETITDKQQKDQLEYDKTHAKETNPIVLLDELHKQLHERKGS